MPAVTPRMRIDSILDLVVQLGRPLPCVECHEPLLPGQVIQFDHRQATVHDGAHSYTQIRPVHYDPCHKKKTKRDVQAKAKRDRIINSLEQQARRTVIEIRGSDDVPGFDACVRAELAELKKQQPKGRPLKSRGFQKPPAGYKHKFGSRGMR